MDKYWPTLLIMLVGFVYITTTYGFVETCVESQNFMGYCDGGDVIQPTCVSGFLQNKKLDCGSDTCTYGKCLPKTCTSNTQQCVSNYTYITRSCVGGSYVDTYNVCGTGQYCSGGACKYGGATCGDGICGSNENEITCLKDCGSLSSWDSLAKDIGSNSDLQQYLSCGGVFDCNTIEVKNLADRIMVERNVKTPREYVDAVNDYVYNYITYRLDGGNKQCGESTSDLIKIKEANGVVYGNCVDYASTTVALLRSKGIPSREVGGCLTSLNFQCVAFAIKPQSLEGIRYGNLNSGQPLAHAYVNVWISPSVGWAIADPTVGQTVSKCISYNTIDILSPNTQVCYLSTQYESQCVWQE